MKILNLLFSIYIMILSMVPCGDSVDFFQNNTVSFSSINQSQNQQDKHSGVCTPFCNCKCCHTTLDIAFKPLFIKIEKKLEISAKFPNQQYALISMFNKNIWQPPKITA